MRRIEVMSDEKRIPTTEKLAQALEQANAPAVMIEQARTGYYDDYKSTVSAPIMALVVDCRRWASSTNGLQEIAELAKGGEYDAPSWEADEWAKSEEGQATFAEFMSGFLPKDK
jgi:hypothetical protein